MNIEKGHLYWITGLSGAGKTTTGQKLYNYIKSKKDNIVLLDGDILRNIYQFQDYSNEGRRELGFRNSRLCKMLTDQGLDVIICLIGMIEDLRVWNRENIENYHEIWLNTALDELIKRDPKQLYAKALKNEISGVLGINADYEKPKNPDLVIENDGSLSPDDVVDKIIKHFSI